MTEERQFEFSGGHLALDFANTVGGSRAAPREHLGAYADLLSWARQAGLVTAEAARRLRREAERHPREAAAALQRAVALREAIFRTGAALAAGERPTSGDLETLNAELARTLPHARLERSDGGVRWSWEEGGLDRPLWPVARAAGELLVSGDLRALRECASDTCEWLFLDRSRNQSRRWCAMSDCGNRAKARRYYERRKRAGRSS